VLEALDKGEELPEGVHGRERWRSILLGGTG
jgi:hypothetical protein